MLASSTLMWLLRLGSDDLHWDYDPQRYREKQHLGTWDYGTTMVMNSISWDRILITIVNMYIYIYICIYHYKSLNLSIYLLGLLELHPPSRASVSYQLSAWEETVGSSAARTCLASVLRRIFR